MVEQLTVNLSFGQQKLLTLACCLATDAPLLDEPLVGVYPEIVERILSRRMNSQFLTMFIAKQL
jgi:ABC-type branched-subunit amino acid transport system ATPase component